MPSFSPVSEHKRSHTEWKELQGKKGCPKCSSVGNGSSLLHLPSVYCNISQFVCDTHDTGKQLKRVLQRNLKMKTLPITQTQINNMKMAEPTLPHLLV